MSTDKRDIKISEIQEIKRIINSKQIKPPKGYVSNTILEKWDKELENLEYNAKKYAAMRPGGKEASIPQERTSLSEETNHKDLLEWLSFPEENKEELLNLSRKFYFTISKYAMSINYYQGLLKLDKFLIPKFEDYDSLDFDEIREDKKEVDAFMEGVMNDTNIRKMIKAIFREGGYYGIIREEGDTPFLQRLPNSHCRSTLLVNGEAGLEFNFSYFDGQEELLETYPKEFTSLYKKYQNDDELTWQLLDIEKSIAVPSEAEDIDTPFLIAMFRDMLELDDYYTYMKQSIQSEIDKMIVQKIPMNEATGDMLVAPALAEYYHQVLSSTVDQRYGVITTPFEIDDVNFKVGKGNDSGFSGLDTMETKVSEGSGISPAIFRESTATAVKANHNANLTFVYGYIERIEWWANRRLKERATQNGYYKLKILPTTFSNMDEYATMFQQLLSFGGPITPLIAVTGVEEDDFVDLMRFENGLKVKELLIPPTTSHTGGGANRDIGETGRPEEDVDDLSDAGIETRDGDGNDR